MSIYLYKFIIATLMQRPLFFPPQQVFDLVPLALYYQYNVSTCLFINCLPMNSLRKHKKPKFQQRTNVFNFCIDTSFDDRSYHITFEWQHTDYDNYSKSHLFCMMIRGTYEIGRAIFDGEQKKRRKKFPVLLSNCERLFWIVLFIPTTQHATEFIMRRVSTVLLFCE